MYMYLIKEYKVKGNWFFDNHFLVSNELERVGLYNGFENFVSYYCILLDSNVILLSRK